MWAASSSSHIVPPRTRTFVCACVRLCYCSNNSEINLIGMGEWCRPQSWNSIIKINKFSFRRNCRIEFGTREVDLNLLFCVVFKLHARKCTYSQIRSLSDCIPCSVCACIHIFIIYCVAHSLILGMIDLNLFFYFPVSCPSFVSSSVDISLFVSSSSFISIHLLCLCVYFHALPLAITKTHSFTPDILYVVYYFYYCMNAYVCLSVQFLYACIALYICVECINYWTIV